VLIELWAAGREPVSTEARERRHQTPATTRRPLLPKCLPAGAISADSPADYSSALLGRTIDLVSDLLKGCQSNGNAVYRYVAPQARLPPGLATIHRLVVFYRIIYSKYYLRCFSVTLLRIRFKSNVCWKFCLLSRVTKHSFELVEIYQNSFILLQYSSLIKNRVRHLVNADIVTREKAIV